MPGQSEGDAQRPVAPAAKAPSPPRSRRAQDRSARCRRRTPPHPPTPRAGAATEAAPATSAPHTARPRGGTGARRRGGRVSFLLVTVRPRSARARRGGTALGRRYGHGGGTHLSSSPGSRLPPQAQRRQQLKAAVTPGRGGSGRTDALTPRRSVARQPLLSFPSPSASSLPPGINKVFKMAGSRAARRKREGGGQSAPAARPAGGGRA